MPPSAMDPAARAALREAASEWFVRMRGPDAERSRPAFEAWLAASADHRAMYNRVSVGWEQSRLITHTPTGQAWQGLPEQARTRRGGWGYAVAAGFAALLVLGFLLAPRTPVSGPQIAAQQLSSPVGIRKVRLGDGSVVTLDAGTRLELLFSAGERRVRLRTGRARFEVPRDAARPFIVAASGREVIATGTVFDVSCADGAISVALLRGSVDIRDLRPDAPRQLLARLTPGQAIQLAPGSTEAKRQAMTAAAADWPSGMDEFDDTPLSEVVAVANRYSDRHLVLGDPAIGSLRVTGAYKMGNPEALAATLAAAFDLVVTKGQDNGIILSRRR